MYFSDLFIIPLKRSLFTKTKTFLQNFQIALELVFQELTAIYEWEKWQKSQKCLEKQKLFIPNSEKSSNKWKSRFEINILLLIDN